MKSEKGMTKVKKMLSIILIAGMIVSLAVECGNKTATTENKGSSKYRVCMVTDAGDITDQSFNQTTYEAGRAITSIMKNFLYFP